MSLIESVHNTKVSLYLNRYLLCTIDDDVCELSIGELDAPAFVYSKIGRFAIIGLLHFPSAKNWKGKKLHVRHKKFGSSVYEVDAVVMQYINDRATRTGNSLTSMSRKQQAKVKQAIEANEDVYTQSEYARAYAQDFLLSGEEAKTITAPKPSKSD